MAEKKKLKKPGWIEEFKAFAIKGNGGVLEERLCIRFLPMAK